VSRRQPMTLCADEGCRRLDGHLGGHQQYPTEAWSFMEDRDQKKLSKAGFATPRGGEKGAYQNHVSRSSQVIIPFERLDASNPELFEDGYVVRLLPDQFFSSAGTPKPEFVADDATVLVGENAFVLYRTYEALQTLPPLNGWTVRALVNDGEVVDRRGRGAEDTGDFVLRLSTAGAERPKVVEGPPQGIFAPEYATEEVNFLTKCVLAWLTAHTYGSPYTSTQARHLEAILHAEALDDFDAWEQRGLFRNGTTSCPLCLRGIRFEQLHQLVVFDEESGLINASSQIAGATRSTDVNLFHIQPLVYGTLQHGPASVGWGHANCNTRLGQRHCYSLSELQAMDLKIGVLHEDSVETIGWISQDFQMIRSPMGAVWIQVSGEMTAGEAAGQPPVVPPSDLIADVEAEA
jgi:hypothetical protein